MLSPHHIFQANGAQEPISRAPQRSRLGFCPDLDKLALTLGSLHTVQSTLFSALVPNAFSSRFLEFFISTFSLCV